MTRLPPLGFDQLDERQQEVWVAIVARRGGSARLTDENGALIGPFNALLYSPHVGERVAALGEALRFDTKLDRRLLELAVITVAARWKSGFEFWMHSRLALDAGVAPETVEAIRRSDVPVFDDSEAEVVHRFSVETLDSGRVSDETYAEAIAVLGDAQVVELVTLLGYYCLISFILNAFEVSTPSEEDEPW